MFRC